MFDPEDAAIAYAEYLKKEGVSLEPLTPLEAFEWFFRFYAHRRAEGVDLTRDEDLLLFQWGTHDWGDGPRFEVELARQLQCGDAPDDELCRLNLTYSFPPSPALRALGAGQAWCPGPDEVSSFAEQVRKHPAVQQVGMRTDGERTLVIEAG